MGLFIFSSIAIIQAIQREFFQQDAIIFFAGGECLFVLIHFKIDLYIAGFHNAERICHDLRVLFKLLHDCCHWHEVFMDGGFVFVFLFAEHDILVNGTEQAVYAVKGAVLKSDGLSDYKFCAVGREVDAEEFIDFGGLYADQFIETEMGGRGHSEGVYDPDAIIYDGFCRESFFCLQVFGEEAVDVEEAGVIFGK